MEVTDGAAGPDQANNITGGDNALAKTNYKYEKRQKDLAKKQKKEEKRQRKLDIKNREENENPEPVPQKGEESI